MQNLKRLAQKPFFKIGMCSLFVVFVSLIYGLPNFVLSHDTSIPGKTYQPFADSDEWTIYAPLVDQYVEGGSHGDPVLFEHRNDATIMPSLGPLVIGTSAKIFHTDTVGIWQAAHFVLPPFIFLLSFGATFLITRRFYLSLTLGLVFVLTRELATYIPFSMISELKAFVSKFIPYIPSGIHSPLPFSRLLSPGWTMVPLSLFLFAWIYAIQKQKYIFSILAGISYGLLFYSYPFDWVTVTVILGVYFLYAFFSKDWESAKQTVLILFTGIIISIPFWISFFSVFHLPYYSELVDRPGTEHNHLFRIGLFPHYLLWIALSVLLTLYSHKDRLLRYAASVCTAGFIVHNIQVLTGVVPGPEHFLMYSLTAPLWLSYVLIGYALWKHFLPKLLPYKKILIGIFLILVACVVIKAVETSIGYEALLKERSPMTNDESAAYAWLKKNAPPESVVMSPSVNENAFIIDFTHARTFVPAQSSISTASNEELVERYVVMLKIFGLSDEQAIAFLNEKDNLHAVLAYSYGMNNLDTVTKGWPIDPKKITSYNELIRSVLSDWKFNKTAMLAKYKLDYVFTEQSEEKRFGYPTASHIVCLDQVYKNTTVTIFRKCIEKAALTGGEFLR